MACIIINDTPRTINYQTNPLVGSGYLAPGTNGVLYPLTTAECSVTPADGSNQILVQPNTQYNLVAYKFRYSVNQSVAAE